MQAGQITTETAELERLRVALGAALLARVSTGPSGGIQVTLVSERGAETRSVAAPPHAAESPIQAALAELLDRLAPAPARVEPEPPVRSQVPGGVVAGSLVLDGEDVPRQRSTGQLQEEWDRRGGVKPMFGASLLATAQQHRNVPVAATDAAGRPGTVFEDANGIGGGIGARLAVWYMSLPDPMTSGGMFPAVRAGLGLDSNFLYVRYPVGVDRVGTPQAQTRHEARAFWLVNLPLQAGFHLGLGRFTSQSSWRGAVLGIAYSPTIQFEIDMNQTEGEFRFNPFGVELNVDIAAINTAEATDTQIRFTLYGLAPKGDDLPGLITGGLGVVFY
jgi:hypothetical protein